MRLLVAEDDPKLLKSLLHIFEANKYTADGVLNGTDALNYARTNEYDGLVFDIMMPGMDGIEVLKRARSAGVRTPIIMLTAKSQVDDKVQGLDAGANDYLTKPFSAKELMARIRAMTRPATAVDNDILAVGHVQLDRARCSLKGPGGEEHLANREFQLMEFFMSHEGEKFPTERLLSQVWGEDAPDDPGVVWVYISYLPKKLRAVEADVVISASRNQGYSIEVVPAAGDEAKEPRA